MLNCAFSAGEETALIALKTISKWLTFDSKFSTILRETGLLHILIEHCGRLCGNIALGSDENSILSLDWFHKNQLIIKSETRKFSVCDESSEEQAALRPAALTFYDHSVRRVDDTSAAQQEVAEKLSWMRWEETAMKVSGMRVTKVLPSPEFSVALFDTDIASKRVEWKVTVGRTSRGWCGVGVATKDIELGESLRQRGPTGSMKQGRAWFYHDRGFFCNGEIFCDDTVPPFDWRNEICVVGVLYDASVREMVFSCNGVKIPGSIAVGFDGQLFPAVYCSDVGTWFEIDWSNMLFAEGQSIREKPRSVISDSVAVNNSSLAEVKRRHFRMALNSLCTREDARMNSEIHYNTLAQSIDRLIDYAEVSRELGIDLQGLTWEEKQVICDRIWAAAKPSAAGGKVARRKQSIYSLLPASWTLRLDSLVELMIAVAEGDRAGLDEVEPVEIGEIALFILRSYVRCLDDFRHLLKGTDRGDRADTAIRTKVASQHRSFVTRRTFALVVETLAMTIAGNPTNTAIANQNGLFRSMLVLLQTDDYREGSIR